LISDTEPLGPSTDPEQREEALRDALRGIDLGTYDQRIIEWMPGYRRQQFSR
jgi:hypothetical protein